MNIHEVYISAYYYLFSLTSKSKNNTGVKHHVFND